MMFAPRFAASRIFVSVFLMFAATSALHAVCTKPSFTFVFGDFFFGMGAFNPPLAQ
jgi:hypothetical protein